MSGRVDIRALTPEDWQVLREVRLQALARSPEVFGSTFDQEKERPETVWHERLASPLAAIFAGFAADKPVAMVGIRRQSGGNVAHRAEIWGVYVDEAVRGQGVARRLLEAAIAHARSWPGVEALELGVLADNAPARTLYESLGFHAFGTLARAIKHKGAYGDEIMMSLPVDG